MAAAYGAANGVRVELWPAADPLVPIAHLLREALSELATSLTA